jgi:hypothetical protein
VKKIGLEEMGVDGQEVNLTVKDVKEQTFEGLGVGVRG